MTSGQLVWVKPSDQFGTIIDVHDDYDGTMIVVDMDDGDWDFCEPNELEVVG